MDDLQFLDSLEFRANIRKHDHHPIDLSSEDFNRLMKIKGFLYFTTRYTHSFTKESLLQEIKITRIIIADRVTAMLIGQTQ